MTLIPLVNPPASGIWGISFELEECCYTPRAGRLEVSATEVAGSSYAFQVVQPIPEPGTLVLLGSGIALGCRRRRKHSRCASGSEQ